MSESFSVKGMSVLKNPDLAADQATMTPVSVDSMSILPFGL